VTRLETLQRSLGARTGRGTVAASDCALNGIAGIVTASKAPRAPDPPRGYIAGADLAGPGESFARASGGTA